MSTNSATVTQSTSTTSTATATGPSTATAPSNQRNRDASTPGYCCGIEVAIDRLRESYPRSLLDPRATPSAVVATDTGLALPLLMKIVDAQKTYDGSGSAYTSYVIQYLVASGTRAREVKRRYSDFASLRKCLRKLYPMLVVPPIPEKHSLAEYAAKPGKAKQDPVVIERRKRMLQSFLNRLIWHPILSTEHLVHQFLDPQAMWTNVVSSAKVATLPKSGSGPLAAAASGNTATGTATSGNPVTSLLSSLTGAATGHAGGPLATQAKRPDPEFVAMEAFTFKFEGVVKDAIEKPHRKLAKRYLDVATDYGELSSAYNALSLAETPQVSSALDRVAHAFDVMHASTAVLAHTLDESLGERWHEYVQYTEVIKGVLRYRTELQLAVEHTTEALETKRTTLAGLERAEADANRLGEALRREGYATHSGASTGAATTVTPPKRASGIVSALSDRLTAMLDTDPEATRRQNLAKTRDAVALLEGQRERQVNELTMANEAIKIELRKYNAQKLRDVRAILVALGKLHGEHAKKNLRAWQEAREEVAKIPAAEV
ncbi:hypothetical protein BCR44DRAFT_125767 [Catenaria anguillulae PL171]|uniref:PX domain-containing protein n=1 Tax=Catenaria anguillulae PL171 TaxID=765915 RepID=A0A1Y2HIK2_9FUNG|nr:hypothetical protein BCR44DRAFT_125767 [Catenaria anguillulae PL171]